jgi:hypothetical protein
MTPDRHRRSLALIALTTLITFALAGPAQAAVTVSRAEVSGDRLRIEGQAAPSRTITVDGVAMGTSASGGSFRIERSGYRAPADCTVDVDDGTGPVNARLSGCSVSTPPPSTSAGLASLGVTPSSVEGGATSTATVTLTAAAPSGGAVVALSSDNAAVTVPPSVTVPAGGTSATAVVSTTAVSASTTATVSAAYAGVTRTAALTVTAPAAQPSGAVLESLTLSPSTVQTGTTGTSATLTFSTLTPDGGATVTLSSSNASLATVPASVTVPGRSSTGAFPVAINASGSGTATITGTYNGVSRSAVLTVTTQSLFRIITTSPLPNAQVGQNYAGFIEACCGQGTPYRWSLVSGTVPDGLRFAGDSLRLSRTTAVTGVPTRVQTTTFTVRARDGAGNTATKTFTLTVDPAAPLVVTNGSDRLPDGTVGVRYETGLFAGGGVQPYRWSHVAGTLPPGLSVQASPGRVLGTPTTAGSFTFTVRVDDSSGKSATQQFTIVVAP